MKPRVPLVAILIVSLAPALVVAAAWSPSRGAPGPTPGKGPLSGPQPPSPAGAEADCPQSGGVIFYVHGYYNCEGPAGDPGYRLRATPGFENITGLFDNAASSMRVPAGWSVRLYELADRGGHSVCRTLDDDDLTPDTYDDGTVGLNDTLSSFEVFDDDHCGSSATGAVLWVVPGYSGPGLLLDDEMFLNLTDAGWNDLTSSVTIAPGWSVRLYKDLNRYGAARCFNRSDIDFTGDTFEDGSALDNQVSSIDVYRQPECPGRPCAYYAPVSCGFSADRRNDDAGSTNVLASYSCAGWLPETGPEVVYALTSATPQRVTVRLTNLSVDLDVFVLRGSCNVGACAALSADVGDEQVSFLAHAGQPHYIAVDGYQGAAGSYHIQIACEPLSAVYVPLVRRQ